MAAGIPIGEKVGIIVNGTMGRMVANEIGGSFSSVLPSSTMMIRKRGGVQLFVPGIETLIKK